MDELDDLTELAERRITGIGSKIRANLIPPLWRTVPRYRREIFRVELQAGLTIAALTITQAIAFALLIASPVPAVTGLASLLLIIWLRRWRPRWPDGLGT